MENYELRTVERNASQAEQESFLERQLNEEKSTVEDFDEDTRCGFGILRGKWMQNLASKKSFLFVYTLILLIHHSGLFYFNGIVTTLEKHYKFSSAQIGYIAAVYDIVQTIVSLTVPYYCSKGRFPRWMGFSIFCLGVSFAIYVLPYFIFGAGEDALDLTKEYGASFNPNSTQELIHQAKMKELCFENKTVDCLSDEGNVSKIAAWLLVLATAVAGFGGAIYAALGPVYIDDNVKKSQAPIMLSITYFFRLLASAIGYSMASFSIKLYVSPSLHPSITDEDPRWIGAWWVGHVVFGISMFVLAPIICTFPKTLPSAALRKREMAKIATEKIAEAEISLKDLRETLKRLFSNKLFVCNCMASVFYAFGFMAFFYFQSKYIQIHFLFSASAANLATGTISLVFTAVGLLTSGIAVTIFKPRARYLALWNVATSIVSVVIITSYGYFSCTASSNALIMENSQNLSACNQNCNCDFVQYSPICGENNVTYISSCHAGCTEEVTIDNGKNLYTNCQCINSTNEDFSKLGSGYGGSATTGACPMDCMPKFLMFFSFLCISELLWGTEITTNFLLGVRCVEKRDKAVSVGLSIAAVSLFASIPSPIFFGRIIDSTCLFWGKTCSKQGNCWLYDTNAMRYSFNYTAAGFVLIGTLWDIGTWYYSKDLKIFDEPENEEK